MNIPVFDPLYRGNVKLGEPVPHSREPTATGLDQKESKARFSATRASLIQQINSDLLSQEEEFMRHSLLRNLEKLESDPLVSKFNQSSIEPFKALTLTSLSYSALGTEYEGWNLKSVIDLYSTALFSDNLLFSKKEWTKPRVHQSVIDLKGQFAAKCDPQKTTEQRGEDLAVKIANLQPGQSYTMEGGWTDNPSGHAMIYRFECTADQTFNIYLYNAQQGSEMVQGGKESKWRKRVAPYIFFTGVTYEELFFSRKGEKLNPIVFKILNQLVERGLSYCNNKMQVILDSLSNINHRLTPPNRQSELFISMQRSGNCAVKTTNCMLLDLLKDYSKYKKVSLDLRLKTIISAYLHFKNRFDLDEFQNINRDTHLFQLKEAAANFLRILDTNFKKERVGISEEHYVKAFATIKEIQKDLNTIELNIRNSIGPVCSIGGDYDKAKEILNAEQRIEAMNALPDKLVYINNTTPKLFTPLSSNYGKHVSWNEFSETFRKLKLKIEELQKAQRNQDVIFQIEAAMRNFGHLKDAIPNSLSLDEVQIQQENLLNLQTLYNNEVFALGDIASPAFQNTSMEFLALNFVLSNAVDNLKGFNILKNFTIQTTYFFDSSRKDRLFSLQDPILLEQRQNLESFFQAHQHKPAIWNITNEFKEVDFFREKTAESQFYQLYIQHDTAIADDFLNISITYSDQEPNICSPLHGVFKLITNGWKNECPQLTHIRNLGKSALLACAAQGYFNPNSNFRNLDIDDISRKIVKNSYFFHTGITDVEASSHPYQASYQDFSPKGELNKYIAHPQSEHLPEKLSKENPLIVNKDLSHADPNLPFYIALSEPDIQTTALLQSLENDIERLKDINFRRMVSHMFIKIVERNSILSSPLIESMKDPAMLCKFERLITIGKRKFVDSLPDSNPNVEEMLFLIRLYARALASVRTSNPDYVPSSETIKTITSLQSFLGKALALPILSDPALERKRKQEALIAKVGLLQGIPLKSMKTEEQSELVLSMIALKNEILALSSSEDPSFVRECKFQFFNFENQWHDILKKDKTACYDLGNHFFRTAIGGNNSLNWSFDPLSTTLCASDSSGEQWIIDLLGPSLRNSKGALEEVFGEPQTSINSQRLFKNQRYSLKIFGAGTASKKILFDSPTWGLIQILGNGPSIIQRQIDGIWYTYIPKTKDVKIDLKLNDAIFGDHALWVNLDQPEDIRFCDLETGKELYHTKDGKIYHNETGKIFYPIEFENIDLNIQTVLSRFENLGQISGWIDEKSANKGDILEFNRFRNFEGKDSLQFHYDAANEAWIYSKNPAFHIDKGPDLHLDLQVDHFLPLVNDDGSKRKILIPNASISSRGYSPYAILARPKSENTIGVSLDGQKLSIDYIEFDVSGNGSIITRTTEGKIYLAHLYLAQKKYALALNVIQSISSTETLSKTNLIAINKILNSSNPLSDFSPNASAFHLQVYLMCLKIDPLLKFEPSFGEALEWDYKIYIDGLNSIEHPLQLTSEQELSLIDAFESKPKNEKKKDEDQNQPAKPFQVFENSSENNLKAERKAFLLNDTEIVRNFQMSANVNAKKQYSLIQKAINKIPTTEEDITNKANYLTFYYLFYGNQTLKFKDYYIALKNSEGINTPKTQGIIFEILFNLKYTSNFLNEDQLTVLSSVARSPSTAPPWFEVALNADPMKLSWNRSEIEPERYIKAVTWYNQLAGSPFDSESEMTWDFKRPKVISSQNRADPWILSWNPFAAFISKKQETPKKILNNPLSLVEGGQDLQFTKWQRQYLEKNKDASKSELKAPLAPLRLKERDEIYRDAIEGHRNHYHNDCRIARQNEQSKLLFKQDLSDSDYELLLNEMKGEVERCVQSEGALLKGINILVKKGQVKTDIPLNYSLTQVSSLGFAQPLPKLATILRAASQHNGNEALLKLNPHLRQSEIQELRAMAVEYMIEATHRRHIERILTPLSLWLESKQENQPNEAYFVQAQDAMGLKRNYDPTKKLFPLLFEFFSDIRVREKQANIINHALEILSHNKDEAKKNVAFQLIMGGGKTSIIISFLIELISSSGVLPCVMCHHSQLASVKGNLASFQKDRFNKDLFIMDYTMQDLGKENILDLILIRLKEAQKKGVALVMKTSLTDLLELKFILEARRLSSIKSKEGQKEQEKIVRKLVEINQFFNSNTLGIYDECDINLSIMTDVNIPQGMPKMISAEQASLIKKIYLALLDPKIKDLVHLEKNLQAELSADAFENSVLPTLADKLFDSFSLEPKFKPAFIRYVTGKISAEDQSIADKLSVKKGTALNNESIESRENVEFLLHLEALYKSDNIYDKQSAQLIALSWQILCKILKVSLSRSYNRNYGRDPKYDDGRVCPYLAVGTPAITKFANVYISLAYQFQSALNGGISKGELAFLADKMTQAAKHYAHKEKKNFLETAEAIQFEEITSVNLAEIMTQEGMQKALDYINDPEHLEARLNVEAEVAPFHVHYHTQRLSSNAINNVSRFKDKGAIASGGTVYNHKTYHQNFANPYLDLGTEGSILNLLEDRNTVINEIPSRDLENFFTLIRNHKDKKNLRAIVDGGGFFQDCDNKELALKLKDFLEKEKSNEGPAVKAIAYLHKYSQEEIQEGSPKESFVFLKLDTKSLPVKLQNTSNQELAIHGLKSDDIFFLFDELRATGTDIELSDDALFLYTLDHKMLMRTELQQTMRARKIFNKQRGEIIVTTQGRKEIANGGKSFADIRTTIEINEAIALEEQIKRSRFAQLDDIVRFSLLQDLYSMTDNNGAKLPESYFNFFLSKSEDDPYLNGGKILGQGKVKDVIHAYAEKLKIKLKTIQSKKEAEIIKAIDKLVAKFAEEISDTEYMNLPGDEDMECEVLQEAEIQMQLELENEQEIELDQELLNELQTQDYPVTPLPYVEREWNLNSTHSLWNQLGQDLIGIKDTLMRTDFHPSITSSTQKYAKYFPDFIKMTANFYRTSQEDLPLLHPHIKEAKFVLALKDDRDQYQFALVSEKDAAFFKHWLPTNPSSNAYLVDLNGFPEGNTAAFYIEFSQQDNRKALEVGLCFANIFNGSIDYLEEHPKTAKSIIPNDPKNLMRFIELKLIRTKGKEALNKLVISNLFNFNNYQPSSLLGGILFSSRRKLMKQKYHAIQKMTQEEIAHLHPDDIPNISKHQVPWLKTLQQVHQLDEQLVNYLTVEQIKQGLIDESIFELLKEKSLVLAALELHPEFFKVMTAAQAAFLTIEHKDRIKELIYPAFTGLQDELYRFLTLEQINQIDSEKDSRVVAILIHKKQIEALEYPDFLHIAQKDIPILTQAQLNQLNAEMKEDLTLLHQLDQSQISVLSNRLINALSPQQIAYALPPEKVSLIENVSLMLDAIQLNPEVLHYISRNQAAMLTDNERDYIPKLKYPAFTGIDQTLYSHLDAKQIDELKPDNNNDLTLLHSLGKQKIEKITNALLLNKLKSHQLQWITGPMVNHFPLESISSLSDSQIKSLTDKERINSLSSEKIQFVSEDQRENIDNIDLLCALPNANGLTREQLNRIKNHVRGKANSMNNEIEIELQPWLLVYVPRGTGRKKLIDILIDKRKLKAGVDPDLQIISSLGDEQIKRLDKNDSEDLKYILKLNDRQFNTFHKCLSREKAFVTGVAMSIFSLLFSPLTFSYHFGKLVLSPIASLYSKEKKANIFGKRLTYFKNSIIRIFLPFLLIFSGDPAYQRNLLRYSIPD